MGKFLWFGFNKWGCGVEMDYRNPEEGMFYKSVDTSNFLARENAICLGVRIETHHSSYSSIFGYL